MLGLASPTAGYVPSLVTEMANLRVERTTGNFINEFAEAVLVYGLAYKEGETDKLGSFDGSLLGPFNALLLQGLLPLRI